MPHYTEAYRVGPEGLPPGPAPPRDPSVTMATRKKNEECLQWIADEQMVHETTEYGGNQRSVQDALAEQRRRNQVVQDYSEQVDKTRKSLKDEDDKIKLQTAHDSLIDVSGHKLGCLEAITQIAGLEEAFGNLTVELAERATRLVEETTKDREDLPPERLADGVARTAQGCILAVRNNWSWITKLVRCTDIHLKNVADYHQFFHEMKEFEQWMPVDLNKAQRLLLTAELKGTREQAGRLLLELKTVLSIFLHWQGKVDGLFDRARKIVPVHQRTKKLDYFRPISSLCNYRTNDINVQEGEELTLLDNKLSQTWLVKNNRDHEAYVPSIICLIPPSDPQAVNFALRMRLQLLGTWTGNVKRVGKTIIEFLLLVFREWTSEEEEVLKALPEAQKKELARMCDYIEGSLVQYWEKYPPFKKLQGRFDNMRSLLKMKGDPKYLNNEMGRALVVQIGVVEDLLKRYKDFWTYWETYKILVESSRHSELILICDKWEQLKFISTLELLKKWHIGLEFDEDELREGQEVVEKMEVVQEIQTQQAAPPANGTVTEEETSMSLESRRETAETDQFSVAEQEERKTFVITGVVDPRTDEVLSLDDAVRDGIINQQTGTYVNPITKDTYPIPVAMNAGLIKVEFVSTKKSVEKRRDIGLITIKTERDSRPYTIKGAIDAKTYRELTVEEAVAEGILDLKKSIYRNKVENSDLSLADALDSGLLLVEFTKDVGASEPEVVTKTYAIYAVIDMKNKKRVPFADAVRQHLFNPETGSYRDNKTGEDIYVGDAIRRGLIKASVVNDPQGMDIPQENKIVLDRMRSVKDKLLKPMTALSALKRAGGQEVDVTDGLTQPRRDSRPLPLGPTTCRLRRRFVLDFDVDVVSGGKERCGEALGPTCPVCLPLQMLLLAVLGFAYLLPGVEGEGGCAWALHNWSGSVLRQPYGGPPS